MLYNQIIANDDLERKTLNEAQRFSFSPDFVRLAISLCNNTPVAPLPFTAVWVELEFETKPLAALIIQNENGYFLCNTYSPQFKHRNPIWTILPSVPNDYHGDKLPHMQTQLQIDAIASNDPELARTKFLQVDTLNERGRKFLSRDGLLYLQTSMSVVLCALTLLSLKSQYTKTTVVETPQRQRDKILRYKKSPEKHLIRHTHVDVNMTEEQRKSLSEPKGSHASPGIHLRRGHFKYLPKKAARGLDPLTWWSPCIVGDKNNGIITHDYGVSA